MLPLLIPLYQLSDSAGNPPVPTSSSSSTRILGIGWGLFLLFLLGVLVFLVCLIASKSDRAGSIFFLATTCYACLVAVLVASPKELPGHGAQIDRGNSLKMYDHTYYPRIVFAVFMILSSLFGVAGVMIYYIFIPVYANKKIS